MPCVKIVVLIVELTPLRPKGEAGGGAIRFPRGEVLCEIIIMGDLDYTVALMLDKTQQTVAFDDH